MSDINDKCLEVFPTWLESLGNDVQTILDVLKGEELEDETRRYLTGGINYLFKSLDLIPDGVDDLGYLDDAFILRLCTKAALEGETGSIDKELVDKLNVLVGDIDIIKELLEDELLGRLDKYARKLKTGAARGRMVDEIVEQSSVFQEFATETKNFIAEYSTPGFSKDEKNLIRLKAFFDAKLPK
ncbi:MAG: DUF1232 domain-containing protein [Deltaproteobacteria bacterium]|nr:DUF1232 domain-containing protein [Deltaproteobacteria bacterium]